MKKISIAQAAEMMGVCEQQVRVMIQRDKIPGASCHGPKCRRTYYITDEHVTRMMKGVSDG